jgi:branched-chain amino acid transport system permease protein
VSPAGAARQVAARMAGHRRALGWAALAAVLVALPFGLPAAQLSTAVFILITAIGAVGLNVVTGYAGQISLGQAFFMAVGAYTGAVLGMDHGMNGLVWIPAGGVLAALTGALIGPSALRLRGFYLAIVTIGLVFIGQHILFNVASISGGEQGRRFPAVTLGPLDFSSPEPPSVAGVTLTGDQLYYLLSLLLLALSLVYVANLRRTRLGRAMLALRERELAAAVMGVDVARTKVAAFTISSFLAGICGALYAAYLSDTQPATWDLTLSVQFVAAIIVGGMGTVIGPVLGAGVVFALPSVIQTLPVVSEGGSGSGPSPGELSAILYGLLIVLFLVVEPRGLAGLFARLGSLLRSRPAKRAAITAVPADRMVPASSTTNPLEGKQ